jgi:hypothetical protein
MFSFYIRNLCTIYIKKFFRSPSLFQKCNKNDNQSGEKLYVLYVLLHTTPADITRLGLI